MQYFIDAKREQAWVLSQYWNMLPSYALLHYPLLISQIYNIFCEACGNIKKKIIKEELKKKEEDSIFYGNINPLYNL
jgi:hypothetical protein